MRHIAVLAHSFGVEVNPHVWGRLWHRRPLFMFWPAFRSPITACLPASLFWNMTGLTIRLDSVLWLRPCRLIKVSGP